MEGATYQQENGLNRYANKVEPKGPVIVTPTHIINKKSTRETTMENVLPRKEPCSLLVSTYFMETCLQMFYGVSLNGETKIVI